MKLTTTKLSVPVLMLMIFQSGYGAGASDWFFNAFGMASKGQTLEAIDCVREANPSALKVVDKDVAKELLRAGVNEKIKDFIPRGVTGDSAEDFQNKQNEAFDLLVTKEGKTSYEEVETALKDQIVTTFYESNWWKENSDIDKSMSDPDIGWIAKVGQAWDSGSEEEEKKAALKDIPTCIGVKLTEGSEDNELEQLFKFVEDQKGEGGFHAGTEAERGLIDILARRVLAEKEKIEDANVETAVKDFLKVYWYRVDNDDNAPDGAIKAIANEINFDEKDTEEVKIQAVKIASTWVVGSFVEDFLRHAPAEESYSQEVFDRRNDLLWDTGELTSMSDPEEKIEAVSGSIEKFDEANVNRIVQLLNEVENISAN